MAHTRSHRIASATLSPGVRTLETTASALLVAYGIVCLVLALTSSDVPGGFIDLGLVAFAAALAGWYAPVPTGALLAVSGGLLGPAVYLVAYAVGGTYAAAAPARQLVFLFAVPVLAGVLLLAAGRIAPQRP